MSMQDVLLGHFSLVYISPEQLLGCGKWREMLRSDICQKMMVGFIVDEAHCVKKWYMSLKPVEPVHYNNTVTFYRGDDFRQEFKHLGEVRSLIPQHINIMALTATATKSLRKDVCKTLGMKDPFLVTVSPDKTNLIFRVLPYESLEMTFRPVIDELRRQRVRMEKTLIYCQQQETCARLYLLFRLHLAGEFTDPIGYLDLPQFRLVDMFTSGTHPTINEVIIASFSSTSDSNCKLRVLISTVAFGMGVNPSDVHQIYHSQ